MRSLHKPLLALIVGLTFVSCQAGGIDGQGSSGKPKRYDLGTVNSAIASSRSLTAVFLNDTTIAVKFTSGAGRNGDATPAEYLATFDLSNGSVRQRAQIELGQQGDEFGFAANPDHNLFVVLKSQARIFDADLRVLKTQTLPSPGLVRALPDRKVAVVWPYDGAGTVRRIDMQSLDVSDVGTPEGTFSAMSEAFAARRVHSAAGSEPSLLVRAAGESWRPVALPAGQASWCCGPTFVSSNVVIDGDRSGQLYWVDAQSGEWAQTSMGEDHRGLKFIDPTPDGRRFAAVRIDWRWVWMPLEGSGRFEWRDGVQVYDVATRKPIFTKGLDVSWWHNRSFNGAVAISPSGHRLLVYDTAAIEVYELPKS